MHEEEKQATRLQCKTLTVLTVDGIVGGKVVGSFWRAGDSPGNKKTVCNREALWLLVLCRAAGEASLIDPESRHGCTFSTLH